MFDKQDDIPDDPLKSLTEDVEKLLAPHFSPAGDAGSANMMLSTEELHFQITQHAPETLPVGLLRPIMLTLNYREIHTGEGFVWLLKKR